MTTTTPTSTQAMHALWVLYRSAPAAERCLAALRPHICPLEPLMRQIQAHHRVLDIGCGNGLFLASLSRFRAIASGAGVDVDGSAIATARRMAEDCGYPLEFHRVERIQDWPTGSFDVVSMVDVMHHVPAALRVEFMQQALLRVAPGGMLLYKDMCAKPWWRVGWNVLHDLLLARQWVRVEPLANVLSWATQAGFEVVERSTHVAALVYGHEVALLRRREGPAPGSR